MAPSFPHPDVVRLPATRADPAQPPQPQSPSPSPSPRVSDFIIVKLFALRLALRLIEGLENYSSRDSDITWLNAFLRFYPRDASLAKVSRSRKDDYMVHYAQIVRRMKRQPRFPVRFMQMNPDPHVRLRMSGRGRDAPVEMDDACRRRLVDFCDAASEWGSVVLMPASEARRMTELADQRGIVE